MNARLNAVLSLPTGADTTCGCLWRAEEHRRTGGAAILKGAVASIEHAAPAASIEIAVRFEVDFIDGRVKGPSRGITVRHNWHVGFLGRTMVARRLTCCCEVKI
jgi:hypothetical protein